MKQQPRLLTTAERSAIMSRTMTAWWAARREAQAKAERKAKREAKKAEQATTLTKGKVTVTVLGEKDIARELKRAVSGVKVKLPRGTKVEDGKVKPPSPNVGRTKPQQYAAKTKRTWRKAG